MLVQVCGVSGESDCSAGMVASGGGLMPAQRSTIDAGQRLFWLRLGGTSHLSGCYSTSLDPLESASAAFVRRLQPLQVLTAAAASNAPPTRSS